jgi:hypothetical protein
VASTYAGILGFLAFTTALAHGWLHGHPANFAVVTAMVSMATLAAAGLVVGGIAQRLVDQEVRWRLSQEQSPDDPDDSGDPGVR